MGQGQTTPRGQNFDVNRNILSLRSFVTSFKKSLWSLILYTFFNDFIYSPRAGADNPMGTNFLCQQKGLITLPICCKFQKNLFEVWFYTYFFMLLYIYLAPWQGQTTPGRQNFDVNRKAISFYPFVASLKNISLTSDFIHIF